MTPFVAMQTLLISSGLIGVGCGILFFRLARHTDLARRSPFHYVLAGFMIAVCSAILTLAVGQRALPALSANLPIEQWGGSPMLLIIARLVSYLFLLFVGIPVMLVCLVHTVPFILRREFEMAKMLLVPVTLYLLSCAFFFWL